MDETNSVSLRFKNSVTGAKKLQEYEQQLKRLKIAIDGLPDDIKVSIQDVKNTKELTDENKNANNISKELFSTAKVAAFAKVLSSTVKVLTQFTSKATDFLENQNLMNVAFHNTGDGMNEAALEGEKLVNTMSEMYSLDESGLTRTVGLFKQLANAMGLSDELGNKLTKTLTYLSNDIASLYNTSFERATEVLQSSLAGQTKPIRGLAGGDITESTLQVTLEMYGIDRTIRDLSYVEKRLIIVTSLLNQLKESQNDYGKQIESVANQMRIFNEQVERIKVALGRVFIPIIQTALPYINAFAMVMAELINLLADGIEWIFGLFGVEINAGFAATSESVWDFSDGLEEANDNAKKLKQGLRGFDKLNVITTPTSTSGISGSGGIDQDIIDAFNKATADYEKKLDKIKNKATGIRDSIMEWLGFTKLVDDETGEVSFKFDHITGGTVLGLLAGGGTIYLGVSKILGMFKKIGGLLTPTTGTLAKGTISWGKLLNGGLIIGSLYVIAEVWGDIYDDIKNLDKEAQNILKTTREYKKSLIPTLTLEQNLLDLEINRTGAMETYNKRGNKALDTIKQQVLSSEDYLDTIKEQVQKEGISLDTKKDALKNILDQYYWNKEVITKLQQQGKDTSELVTINEKYRDAIKELLPQIDSVDGKWEDVAKELDIAEGIIDDIKVATGEMSLSEKFIKTIDQLKTPFKNVYDTITDTKSKLEELTEKNWLAKFGINLSTSSFKKGLETLFTNLSTNGFGAVFSAVGLSISSLIKKIPRLETGMDFVPKDYYGPVFLDYGERVLTKEENQAYMRGNVTNNNISTGKTTVSPTIVVQVGNKEIARQVLRDLQDMATANGQPIEIGG